MSAPNDGYGQYQAPPEQYDEQSAYPEQTQGYENPAAHHAPQAGRKKKRAYAAGAFDVAAGGNAASTPGQPPAPGPFGAPQPAAPGYATGYPQQDPQAAAYGAPLASPGYGMQQPGVPAAGAGGYQAPEPYYPSAGAPPPTVGPGGGVAGLTSGVAGMQLGSGHQQPVQPAPNQGRPVALNQLYPTDLINQPFNVSELDLPPPPIILPPNVSYPPS